MKLPKTDHAGFLLLVTVVLVGLLALEGAYRLAFKDEISSGVTWEDEKDGSGFSLRADREGRHILTHAPFNDTYEAVKPPGVFRIIFIGDSMTEGGAVPPELRFTTLLESWLNEQNPPGAYSSYEVLNFGVPGYNIEQIADVFYEAQAFSPDLVIYNYYVNDADHVELRRGRGGRQELVTYRQSVPYLFSFPGNGTLLRYSVAYRLLNRAGVILLHRLRPHSPVREYDMASERFRDMLHQMIRAAGDDGIGFAVMLAPLLDNTQIDIDYFEDDVITASCVSGLKLWDVSRELSREYQAEELRINDTDSHPNEKGHAAIAESLKPYFERYILNEAAIAQLVPSEFSGQPCEIV